MTTKVAQMVKNLPAMQGSISGSERYPGEGNGSPLQYSCLENAMDRGAWRATVHAAAKSWTRLSDFTSPGIEPTSPALEGKVLATGPPGKP